MTIYWSLQTEEAWKMAKTNGYLAGIAEYAMYPKEYLWMIEQMRKRLTNFYGEYPVWLWIRKPDMRSSGHFESNTKCIRLSIELDERDVLVSDFDGWHFVLNDSFNADCEKEYDNFYAGKLSISKEESWERIFDLKRPRDIEWSGNNEWLQGTTGKVPLNKIKKVEHFISRKQPKYLL